VRTLSDDLISRADVSFAGVVQITSRTAGGVITEPPTPLGTQVSEGAVVYEISERPLLALAGSVPMYRDLTVGMSGIDVQQLEDALSRGGLNPGSVDGVYDQRTSAAVVRWYASAGYPAPAPPEAAQAQVADAQSALETAMRSGGDDLDALHAATLVARSQLGAAIAAADAARAQVAAAVTAQQVARARADSDAAIAGNRLEQAQQGTHPDTGEPPTAAEMRELETTAGLTSDAAAVARSEEEAAVAQAAAVDVEQDAEVERAQIDVETADAQLRTAERRSDGQSTIRTARARLQEAEAHAGVGVPVSELVFVPSLPAEVVRSNVVLGSPADGVLGEVSGSQLSATVEVSTTSAAGVERGDLAELDSSEPALEATGTVTDVHSAEDPSRTQIVVIVTDPSGAALRDRNVRVTIPRDSSDGEVFVVPLSAVTGHADRTTWLEVERDGTVSSVEVTVGLIAGGEAAVDPADDGDLREGDLVTVGSGP
jgi:multidrug efflux pump subunit AcrA (membrane-fusion protein)